MLNDLTQGTRQQHKVQLRTKLLHTATQKSGMPTWLFLPTSSPNKQQAGSRGKHAYSSACYFFQRINYARITIWRE